MKGIRDILPRRDRGGSDNKQGTHINPDPEKQPMEENNNTKSIEDNSAEKNHPVEQTEEDKLFAAAKRGDTKVVDACLNNGVPVDCRDKMERTPLIIAAEGGHAEVVKLLLKLDAEVDAANIDGETAVITATLADNLDVVKMLHLQGADLEIRNKQGRTALDIAKDGGAANIASYLEEQLSGGQNGTENKPSTDLDNDDPSPNDPAVASSAAAMWRSQGPESYVDQSVVESIPGADESPYFRMHKEPEATSDYSDNSAGSETGTESPNSTEAHGNKDNRVPGAECSLPDNPQATKEERIEFDALDNRQVRSINQKVIKVLDKAGFEVGDFVIDTVFKGRYLAVLKPRSQENKRWRKLRKHPDWVIDPKRLTELAGACAVRRYCLAEGKDMSSFTISHFIELYYVKDLKLILTLAEEAHVNKYTVRQLKSAAADLREHKDDHDPGKEIIRTLDQPVPILEDPDLMALCSDKDRVLEELSKAERKRIKALIKERKPGLDEVKKLMETFEVILFDLEDK